MFATRTVFTLLFLLFVCAQSRADAPARIFLVLPSTMQVHMAYVQTVKAALRQSGLVEKKHYVLEERYIGGNYQIVSSLFRDLLKRDPALLIVVDVELVRAAQAATKTVPIVFIMDDPTGTGVVASLAHPGGNVTGLATYAEETMSKYVDLVREVIPRASRIAVLVNPDNQSNPRMFEHIRASAAGLGIESRAFEVTSPEKFDAAFNAITAYRPDAILLATDIVIFSQRERYTAFALNRKIPLFGDARGLMYYGASRIDLYRRSANYVKKILEGAKPGDLPVEKASTFNLWLNLTTAEALGLDLPQSLVLRADEIIR